MSVLAIALSGRSFRVGLRLRLCFTLVLATILSIAGILSVATLRWRVGAYVLLGILNARSR